MSWSKTTWCSQAEIGPTLPPKTDWHRHCSIGPMSICWAAQTSGRHWANIGPMLGQPSANVGATLAQPLGDVGPTFFCQHFTNLLGNFLPTFGRPFTNLYLLILSYNVHHVRHNFWCLKDAQKISHFKAYFGICFEAWHSHDILKTSRYYVCYKSDSDFVWSFSFLHLLVQIGMSLLQGFISRMN